MAVVGDVTIRRAIGGFILGYTKEVDVPPSLYNLQAAMGGAPTKAAVKCEAICADIDSLPSLLRSLFEPQRNS